MDRCTANARVLRFSSSLIYCRKRAFIENGTMIEAGKIDTISPEAYLLGENDRADDVRYEFCNGHIYAMAGASRNHNRLTGNIFLALANQLQSSDCQVFQSDMKVSIRSTDETHYYYPDVQVTCEEEPNEYFNSSPCLIVEVLSNSTARIDQNEKLKAYRLIPALQEYVICSQDYAAIAVYRLRVDWKVQHYGAGEIVQLESVGVELLVDDLYGYLSP